MDWLKDPIGDITQGSIVDGVDWGFGDDNPLSIVISNACDLANGKSSYLIVAALQSAVSVLSETKEFKNIVQDADENKGLKRKTWSSLQNYLKDFIHNKNICRYYFFDSEPVFEAGLMVVDFQLIKSLNAEEKNNISSIAQMASPFVEQMIMHFTAYTARIPSDRVESSLEEKYIEILSDGYHFKG